MQIADQSPIIIENAVIHSHFLERDVKTDFYFPPRPDDLSACSLLFINDGQDMEKLGLKAILQQLYLQEAINPLLVIGIHAGPDRKMEYGVAGEKDYRGRGAKAELYTSFVLQELVPFIHKRFPVSLSSPKAFAGFSLGGLMALDIVWKHPEMFSIAGVFSGSLWWRNIDQNDKNYNDDMHRIMHQQIKKGAYKPGMKFYFTTGSLDETRDRNNNGVIDSIDDTLSLIDELERLGYEKGKDIWYINYEDGKHDVPTWGRAMPGFLKWAFS